VKNFKVKKFDLAIQNDLGIVSTKIKTEKTLKYLGLPGAMEWGCIGLHYLVVPLRTANPIKK
jgi:hypothetical protein